MLIEETFVINAPQQKVWDFFLNIEQVAKCMPGAEVKQVDANNFEGDLKVKVGPIGAAFSGTVSITQQTPPNSITATAKGKDKTTASMVQGEFSAGFKALSSTQTEVSYKIDVAIRGKMGQFGQTVIQDIAKRLTTELLACVKSQIETPEGQAPLPPPTMNRMGWVAIGAFFKAIMSVIVGLFKRKSSAEQKS